MADWLRKRVLPPPTLDATQREAGYNKSLALRQARAELKKDLKAGKLQLGEVLAGGPDGPWDWVKGMKIHDLLRAVPGVGVRKAEKLIREAQIFPTNTVGKCSPAQLRRLVSQLQKRSER